MAFIQWNVRHIEFQFKSYNVRVDECNTVHANFFEFIEKLTVFIHLDECV